MYYYSLGMDMSLMSGFMGMPGMNMGVNPLVQLLNQNGLHPNWPAGLSGIFIRNLGMENVSVISCDVKYLAQLT